MKKALIAVSVLLACSLLGLALIAARMESKIVSNVYLGPIPVGGLSPADAQTKLDAWWATEKERTISFELAPSSRRINLTLSNCGVTPDDKGSIDSLPLAGIMESAKHAVGADSGPQHMPIRFVYAGIPKAIVEIVDRNQPHYEPARIYYESGKFEMHPEHGRLAVDGPSLERQILTATVDGESSIRIPLAAGEKRIGDQQLGQIDEVMSTFTTHFPTSKRDRNTNIRLASGKINGFVMLPGDTFSFNTVVGKRTIEDGFKTAPVFKNGKHDMGVGGGICQVSSTLYNSALFAGLQIVQRHNHSMPVAYLPVGRDATVDYGSLDLAFRNDLTFPIALSADYEAGKLTFRILGKKDPSTTIRIESSDAQTWDAGTKTVSDPALPVGTKKVLDKGSRGHSIKTFRVVLRGGVEVAREPLGRSYYKGSVREIAVGTKPALPTSAIPGVPTPVAKPDLPARS